MFLGRATLRRSGDCVGYKLWVKVAEGRLRIEARVMTPIADKSLWLNSYFPWP
jgi:hypothetical protein